MSSFSAAEFRSQIFEQCFPEVVNQQVSGVRARPPASNYTEPASKLRGGENSMAMVKEERRL